MPPLTFSSPNSRICRKWAISSLESPNVISSPVLMKPSLGITIPEFLRKNLHKWENEVAFECSDSHRKYTHGEVFQKSQSFGASLIQQGFKHGDVSCVLLPNMIEFPVVTLGIWEAGLILSPINPANTRDEIETHIQNCEAKIIITLPELEPVIRSIEAQCPNLTTIIIVGGDDTDSKCMSYSEMIQTDPSGFKFLNGAEINSADEIAILPFSSGTTGLPKGVEITHSTFVTNLLQLTEPGYTGIKFFEDENEQERFLATMPFFHMYGVQVVMAMTLFIGAHTVCLRKFNPGNFTSALKSHKPTCLHMVTPMILFVISSPELGAEDFKDMRLLMAGGAPIGQPIIEILLDKIGRSILFQEGFGMTEVSTLSHLLPPEFQNSKLGASGVLLPGTSCKIVELGGGGNLGPNKSGEIRLHGPQIMKRYYNNEEANANAFDEDGFLCTGDIGYYDEDGCLYIVDRLKELIKVKGFQVAPAELETILRQHPDIADVAVIGVKHERFGEAPRAYVVPKNEDLTKMSVADFLDGKVAGYKMLAGGVEFVTSIPKSAIGKILRRVLIQDYLKKSAENGGCSGA